MQLAHALEFLGGFVEHGQRAFRDAGVGTLTTNPSAGFFLVVGEGGTGTLSSSPVGLSSIRSKSRGKLSHRLKQRRHV